MREFLSLSEVYERVFALSLECARAEEVPVGAIVCRRTPEGTYRVLAEGRNRVLEKRDPTAHAELSALRQAARTLGSERIGDTLLVTTLEPCLMCSGAILLARTAEVHYFAPTESGLGLADVLDMDELGLGRKKRINHRPRLVPAEEYRERTGELLRSFFADRRKPNP